MARWADAAIAAADPLRDRTVTATALAVEAAGDAMAASPVAGKAKRDEAARLVDALSDDELATRLAGPTYLALAEMYLDHFEESLRHAARALAISRATGQGDLLAPITAMLGSGLWVRGRMAEAKEVLSGAVEAARLMDNAQSLCWTLFNYAYALVAAGDIEVALAIGQESSELAQTLDPGPISGHAGSALALALSESGEPARAVEVLVAAAGGEEMPMIGGAWRVRNLELLTRCRLATGNRAEAERAAEAARAGAAEVGLPMAHAMAALARAALELDVDDAASAAGHAREATTLLESVGDSFDAARARVVAGRALGRAGDNDGAAAELERAAAAFASFGVTPLSGGGRTGTAKARPPRVPALHNRDGARRCRSDDRTRAPTRTPRRRPQDKLPDRRRALPEPEDGRGASSQHLPQGRRVLARRARARRRTRRRGATR